MNRNVLIPFALCLGAALLGTGCGKSVSAQSNPAPANNAVGTGPVPTPVEADLDSNNFKVDHPERFPLATADEHAASPELNVNGVVGADVSRQVPVPSLATGRIVETAARLGDQVKKGQLLFKVRSSDIANAYSAYRQAEKNEALAADNERLSKVLLDRARILFQNGAIPKTNLEIAENAEVATRTALADAKIVTETAREQLGLLGVYPDHPTGVVAVFAPVDGTITDQQITNQSAVQSYATPAPFTISDLARVWIICDVWENNMAQVRVGQTADIHLAAYPERVLKGRISNILPTVDPTNRTAKVRIEVENPGLMRIGMFVTATFHSEVIEHRATVPSTAILHLHDRQWVYMPQPDGRFRRTEVAGGNMLPGNLQEVISGVRPGDRVVSNALVFQNTVEQ